MDATTLRSRFPEECEPFSDEDLRTICFFTRWEGPGGFWDDEDIRGYLRDWGKYESYSDVVEINEDIFTLPEGWDDIDDADKEEMARNMIIEKGFIYFTTIDHEVVVDILRA